MVAGLFESLRSVPAGIIFLVAIKLYQIGHAQLVGDEHLDGIDRPHFLVGYAIQFDKIDYFAHFMPIGNLRFTIVFYLAYCDRSLAIVTIVFVVIGKNLE